MASNKNNKIVPNRVFIGCPWKTIRPKYEKAAISLEKKYPIHFVLIGREHDQRAEELLGLIKARLLSSTSAIFDVTGGNPNVSLEYGIAEASGLDRILYLNVHVANKPTNKDSAIIADLAGQKRKQWKNEKGLSQLLSEFAKHHNYTKRFEKALGKSSHGMNRHDKKTSRGIALKTIRYLDEKETVRRADLVEYLKGSGYLSSAIEHVLRSFHTEGLIHISSGRYAEVAIS